MLATSVQERIPMNGGLAAAAAALGSWRSDLNSRLPGLEVTSTSKDLHVERKSLDLAGARLQSLRSASLRAFRTAPDTRLRFAPMVIVMLEGKARMTQFGRTCDVAEGGFVFLDFAEPMTLECLGNFHLLELQFAKTTFAANAFRRSACVPVEAQSAMDRTFVDCVKTLWESGPSLDPLKHSAALGAVVSLSSLTTAFDVQDVEASVPIRVTRAMVYIENNLGESWLNPKAIADAQRVSRRYLDDLFSARGHSIESWVWERRLVRAAEDLSIHNSQWGAAKKTILQIALDLGFSSPSHFSRTFSRRFGVSPREFRKHLTDSTLQ